ncbi:MAG: hypothetical protein M3M96_08310 [Candidatus Eremiobacteraeota bacterium]|nr:hypothetical protein [Candidatus Eremiobacteraeota bacterium]
MNDRMKPSDYGGQTITDDSSPSDDREKSGGMDGDQMNDRGRARDSGDESGDGSEENIDESDD